MQKVEGEGIVTVPVPDHKELCTRTLMSIIRQSGVPRAAYE
jgi:predicted RNA binding protein YcfA (HicA-like mRNA interferase family)